MVSRKGRPNYSRFNCYLHILGSCNCLRWLFCIELGSSLRRTEAFSRCSRCYLHGCRFVLSTRCIQLEKQNKPFRFFNGNISGSSAPELGTVIIGVFFAKDDIGVSGVIGSAVFNIMFVIAVCALFSGTVCHLNWWPLVRDCFFYSLSIIVMLIIMLNDYISWVSSWLDFKSFFNLFNYLFYTFVSSMRL